METFVDYYALLHVQPTAPAPVIKASYRTMMQKLNHHPDRGGDVAFAQLLNGAMQTLCNPTTRACYDTLRQQYLASSRRGDEELHWGEPGGSPDNAQTPQTDETTATGNDSEKTGKETTLVHHGGSSPPPAACMFCHAPDRSRPHSAAYGYAAKRRCSTCNGASTPIEHMLPATSDELRRMHRQQHDCHAQLWMQWPASSSQPSTVSDFSPAGCSLLHGAALKTDHLVLIETRLFNAICKVRHCQKTEPGCYKVGLAFMTLDMSVVPGSLLQASA